MAPPHRACCAQGWEGTRCASTTVVFFITSLFISDALLPITMPTAPSACAFDAFETPRAHHDTTACRACSKAIDPSFLCMADPPRARLGAAGVHT
eukprot:CAMPEP_0168420420 /NCGR_PEP_ID=MMETSP0228-20121227/32765_1 /TAXON_ID=133427 /ORGANISM="Protoceratium reticulatum, Strain CCCM 535 (=CCMP 1889)" /LENGTH=94 /DNA_ID=CAMNT_0008434313 /DNA_START=31 /DNA_END=315 /DNA_ORIENTATION=-